MEAAGIEPLRKTPGNISVTTESGAESGALGAQPTTVDAGLAMWIDTWPTLTTGQKRAILALVEAAGDNAERGGGK